jgi:spheroidene monooxygenase
LAVGLGEAPLLRQATFTIWDSVADMNAYARTGAHLQAIQSAAKHGYFSESMFARFVPLQVQGQWQGNSYA